MKLNSLIKVSRLMSVVVLMSVSFSAQADQEAICRSPKSSSLLASVALSSDFEYSAFLGDGFVTSDEMKCTSVGDPSVSGGRITCEGQWITGEPVVAIFHRYIPGVMEVEFTRTDGEEVILKCEGYVE